MAGFIYLTDEQGLFVADFSFDACAEIFKDYLDGANGEEDSVRILKTSKRRKNVMSLAKLCEHDFMTCYRLLKFTLEECQVNGKCGYFSEEYVNAVISTWEELQSFMEGDRRFDKASLTKAENLHCFDTCVVC